MPSWAWSRPTEGRDGRAGAAGVRGDGRDPAPGRAGVLLIVAGLPLVTYVMLKRLGQYSHRVFGTVSAIAVILGLQLLGGDVVGTVLGSSSVQKILPIIALGGLYVVYKGVQTARSPNQTTELTIDASTGDGGS